MQRQGSESGEGQPAVPADAVLMRTARIAGLRDFETPTLEQVERRRFELLVVTFTLLLVMAIALVTLSAVIDLPGFAGDLEGRTATILRVLLVLLAGAFAAYVWEKERYLGRLSKVLVNERVLSAALANRLKEISSLSEAGKAVVSMLELDQVLKVILDAATDLLEADEGSVQLLEGENLVIASASGHADRYIGHRRSILEGLAGYVARTREPLLIEGRPDLLEFGATVHDRERAIESAISVPLEANGELFGILNLSVSVGERRYNEYDLRALRLFGEHAAMAIKHGRALSGERTLRLQIAELDRLRAELVGSMTHDLKTPLTTIIGNAKLLLRKSEELRPDQTREVLEAMLRQSERLLALIDRLLEAARSQTRAQISLTSIDLVPLVGRVVASFSNAYDRPVALECDVKSLSAYADPDALEQVLSNLLENAVKHTPPQTKISVLLKAGPQGPVLVVADDGPGIPPELRKTLFEPFRQADRSSSGVGLGLFIVSSLVTAMGGRVELHSEPGTGTEFTVTLPTSPEQRLLERSRA